MNLPIFSFSLSLSVSFFYLFQIKSSKSVDRKKTTRRPIMKMNKSVAVLTVVLFIEIWTYKLCANQNPIWMYICKIKLLFWFDLLCWIDVYTRVVQLTNLQITKCKMCVTIQQFVGMEQWVWNLVLYTRLDLGVNLSCWIYHHLHAIHFSFILIYQKLFHTSNVKREHLQLKMF